MDEATNYNYLLELDDKLTSIRAQINNISKQIQIYDKSVALSFVYITLDEVVEYTEISETSPSFGKRIADAFTGTFENFVKFCQEFILAIIWMLPAIIIGGGVTAISIPLIRRRDKKRRESLDNSKKDGNAEENKR
jgi:hypothetical protein